MMMLLKNILTTIKLWISSASRGVILALTSFQLLLYPGTAFAGDISGDANLAAQREACTGAHQYWDDRLNSCTTKQMAVDMKDNSEACASAKDPDACFMREAEKRTGVEKGDRSDKSKAETLGKIIAGIYLLFFAANIISRADWLGNKFGLGTSQSVGNCTSKYILWATSGAWLVGDYFLKKKAKDKFKDMAKNYKKEQENKELKGSEAGSYQAQVRAFTYLKEEQELIKEQAKNRVKLQYVVAAGYAFSAFFAGYEMTPSGSPGACTEQEGEGEGEGAEAASADGATQESATEVETVAEEGAEGAESFAGGSVEEAAIKKSVGALKKGGFKLGTSSAILVGAGIMLALNAFIIHHAKKEQGRAEDNIKAIDEVIATYSQHIAGFCPDGREDLNNERCYCYKSDGTQNENRSQSVICQNLFAADSVNFAALKEKGPDIAAGPRQGCITVTGQFDENCQCRKMKNNVTKQNACANVPFTSAMRSGVGTQIDGVKTFGNISKMNQGANKALGSLNTGELRNTAARNKKVLDSMLKQAKGKIPGIPTLNQIEKLAQNMALKQATQNPQNLSGGFPPSFSGSQNRPPELSAALEKAESKINLKKSPLAKIGTGTKAIGPSQKKNGFRFNWNDAAAREGNKVQTFMDKKYKYKGSDIVKRDDVSLWNVISKRYQTSGLKRLFGEEGE